MRQTCGLSLRRMELTTIHEDNSGLFNWKDDVEIQTIRSCENLADLFTKSLLRRTFEQLVYKIGLRHLNDVSLHEGRNRRCKEQYYIEWCTLFPSRGFYPKGFFLVRF